MYIAWCILPNTFFGPPASYNHQTTNLWTISPSTSAAFEQHLLPHHSASVLIFVAIPCYLQPIQLVTLSNSRGSRPSFGYPMQIPHCHQGRYWMAAQEYQTLLPRAGSLLPSPISSFWTLEVPLGNTKSIYNTSMFLQLSWVLEAFGQWCLLSQGNRVRMSWRHYGYIRFFLSVSKSVFYKRRIPTLKWCKHLKFL